MRYQYRALVLRRTMMEKKRRNAGENRGLTQHKGVKPSALMDH